MTEGGEEDCLVFTVVLSRRRVWSVLRQTLLIFHNKSLPVKDRNILLKLLEVFQCGTDEANVQSK